MGFLLMGTEPSALCSGGSVCGVKRGALSKDHQRLRESLSNSKCTACFVLKFLSPEVWAGSRALRP